MFKPVPSKVSFSQMEENILKFWRETDMMRKYLHRNDNSDKRYSFIDGPITANNPMGVHHAWGRTYKDLFQRFKTMQGYKQRYQNGFDGQGLWIEVEVEKELGFNSKRDIEAFGIDKFVELCKERVRKFSAIQTQQSIRLGYWMDWDNSYHTMSDENNYTIWHFLKTCHERGWIYEGTDVMPWCPRCGTGLSEHEIVTEGYQEIVHPGLFVRFPIEGREKESLLVWTTTPWTLTSNVAVAVHPKLNYLRVKARMPDSNEEEILYLAKGRLSILKVDYEVLEEVPGSRLLDLRYRGPFDELPLQRGVEHKAIPWEEVSESEGTGMVHIAPGCGKEDFALGKKFGLPTIAPLDEFGVFVDDFDWLSGRRVSEVNKPIYDSLKQKGALYRLEDYLHRYPVCWRCGTELVFRLVDEWFISMEELRDLIATVTKKIRWIPEFGLQRELDWLKNMDDWMVSKKRYWGLALPIYKCQCGHFEVIGSKDELESRAVEGWAEFVDHSPHRPWVDAVKIQCAKCGSRVSRIADVGNPWLDAGIVPFSTLDYRTDRDYWREWFPADMISESFPGQFRNWFYSLLTMGTALENIEPFRTVFSYALMRDEKGEEMHKSKGNAIWFEDAAEKMGVDAMRWVFTRHNPAANLNFGYGTADEVRRRFLRTLWNTYSFFVTYANIDRFQPRLAEGIIPSSELDRWIRSELNALIADVTDLLENYSPGDACRRIEEFVELLSNWYVRRSRRRFWKSESDEDKLSAHSTLYHCLVTLSKLLAPFTPFLAEEMYQNLVRSVDHSAPESVHLTHFPAADPTQIDGDLSTSTRLAMRISSLGRSARSKTQIKVRQPLGKALVKVRSSDERGLFPRIKAQVEEELNVKETILLEDEGDAARFFQLRLNLSLVGPRFGSQMGQLTRAFDAAEPGIIYVSVVSGQAVDVDGFTLQPEEVEVTLAEVEGHSAAMEGGYMVAVTTDIPQDLYQEGLARELVHRIQGMRRSVGFDIADHIVTYYKGDERLKKVMEAFGDYISQETLSSRLVEKEPPEDSFTEEQRIDELQIRLGVRREPD